MSLNKTMQKKPSRRRQLHQEYLPARGPFSDIYRYKIQIMCFEQGKQRPLKLKSHQPLIPHKRTIDHRDKQNQKLNPHFHHKIRTQTQHDFYSDQDSRPHPSLPTQTFIHKDRHHHSNLNYALQPPKTLTFGTVKHGKTNTTSEQSSFISAANEQKRQNARKNPLLQKERVSNLTERNQKINIERIPDKTDKRDKKEVKGVFGAKVLPLAPLGNDDFSCHEELDFRPVEKKSLLPEKKYTADRTTSKFDFGKARKPERKERERDVERELREFEVTEKAINSGIDGQGLMFSCQLQEEYSVSPNYLQRNHKGLIWWSRAILVDWMRHICYQFGLKRDTYHIAVVLLDNYLARITNVPKSILQAIGATCLFIASKLEEFQCRESSEFVKSTNNSCSIEDIHELQIKIVMTIRFRLNPPTLFSLANTLMSQWDVFVQEGPGQFHPLFRDRKPVTFKQLDEESYQLFRELMQLIDCSVIDIQTSQYKPRMLVCSFLYLLVGRVLKVFESKDIVEEFPCSSLYLINEEITYNSLFNSFVEQVFGLSLFEMLPTVQYCATYFGLVFSFEKPVIEEEDKALESMSLEEYCSIQTYNNTMIKTVKHRYRGLY